MYFLIRRWLYRLLKGKVMVVRPSDALVDNILDSYMAKSQIHGTGLFSLVAMKPGRVIGVLTGTLMPWTMYKELGLHRYVDLEWNAMPDDWLLVRQKKTKYAAINHSRNPNIELRDVSDRQKEIVVLKPIEPGDELLLDYRKEPLPSEYKATHGWSYL